MKATSIVFVFLILLAETVALANPYLPKPGEKTLSMRVSTCAVSGGFVHLYTALDNGLFDKYGIKLENIFIRGGAQNLTALATDEVQFTYCASDAIIPGMAAGLDVKIVASPLKSAALRFDYSKGGETTGRSEGQSFGNRARRRLERSGFRARW
jgi:ABC-type nitrate/sulfonate/bicarbonate transport system substrate-binding protein